MLRMRRLGPLGVLLWLLLLLLEGRGTGPDGRWEGVAHALGRPASKTAGVVVRGLLLMVVMVGNGTTDRGALQDLLDQSAGGRLRLGGGGLVLLVVVGRNWLTRLAVGWQEGRRDGLG